MSRLDKMATVGRWSRHAGVLPVVQVGAGWLANRVVRTGLARYSAPSLDDHLRLAGEFARDAEDLLAALGVPGDEQVAAEFDEVYQRQQAAYAAMDRAFPASFGVEDQTGRLLYRAVRALRPQVVIETGVADGLSSFVILEALKENGSGALHSFDIDPRAGGLVQDRERWTLTIVPKGAREQAYSDHLAGIGAPVDLFFHDADHRYISQLVEFEDTWPRMAPGGLFISDDIDDSRAFIHFAERHALKPSMMFDRRKIIGAVRVAG